MDFSEQYRQLDLISHRELECKLERAQLMAEVSGQLADQRMRRIQFELLPEIEQLKARIRILEADYRWLKSCYEAEVQHSN